MRLGELLSKDVITENGEHLGKVHDVLLHLDDHGSQPQTLTIEGLIVGTGSLAARLGYTYGEVNGPRPLAALMRRLGRSARYIPWDHLPGVSALVGPMMLVGVCGWIDCCGAGLVVVWWWRCRSRAFAGNCRRRGRVRRRRTGGRRWRTGRGGVARSSAGDRSQAAPARPQRVRHQPSATYRRRRRVTIRGVTSGPRAGDGR